MFPLLYTFCLHFYLINIHIFDYLDSRLSGLSTKVLTSLDNQGSTVQVHLFLFELCMVLFPLLHFYLTYCISSYQGYILAQSGFHTSQSGSEEVFERITLLKSQKSHNWTP